MLNELLEKINNGQNEKHVIKEKIIDGYTYYGIYINGKNIMNELFLKHQLIDVIKGELAFREYSLEENQEHKIHFFI